MNDNPIRVRIVAADQSVARLYESAGASMRSKLIGELKNPLARLHDRELVSDRPGRVFDRATALGQRRGSVSHHGTAGERTPKKHVTLGFARQVVHRLESDRRAGLFSRLVVIAGPAFLGCLRKLMPDSLREVTVAEVTKDVVHETEHSVLKHVPREAFAPAFKAYYSAHP